MSAVYSSYRAKCSLRREIILAPNSNLRGARESEPRAINNINALSIESALNL